MRRHLKQSGDERQARWVGASPLTQQKSNRTGRLGRSLGLGGGEQQARQGGAARPAAEKRRRVLACLSACPNLLLASSPPNLATLPCLRVPHRCVQ